MLARVYAALNASEDAFIFVGVDARGCVAGFVSGVIDVRRMYRRILRRHWLAFGVASLRHLFSIRMLRRILHTLRYPARVEGKYPQAELLSIVVAAEARGSGLATALLDALRAEFRARGVARFKVMVGAHLERANAYYRKHGFVLAGEITSHGRPSNIYVADVDAS
ncbi:MAG: GNAT family N-acetyltransferase [Phycisphaerae bacterium]|nr:GNAT family N-acetyltransferase [Phycisphaerae bacterium]